MLYLLHSMQPNFRLARVHLIISSFVYSDFYLFISFIMNYRYVNTLVNIKTKSQTRFSFYFYDFIFIFKNPRHVTLDPRHITLDPRPSTLYPRPSTLDPRPSTLDPRPSTKTQTHLSL